MKRRRLFAVGVGLALLLPSSLAVGGIIIPQLQDELTREPIGEGIRNLVICIHGWNPPGPLGPILQPAKVDKFKEETEWEWLVDNLKESLGAFPSEPWGLLLYHWEKDAATGLIEFNNNGFDGPIANANQAAEFAWKHGVSLGARLPSSLRRVQIIAHSAGTWCAYQTASALVANNPYVIVQITLLDPYVPDEVLGLRGSNPTLSRLTLNSVSDWDSEFSARLSLLENYFTDDSTIGIPNFPVNILPLPTSGTHSIFDWRSKGINLRVDWSFEVFPYRTQTGADFYYDWHSGPILFYGDTIEAAGEGTIQPGLPSSGLPFIYNLNGWYQSLFRRTELGLLPRITTQPLKSVVTNTGASVTLNVTPRSLLPITYQWFKRGQATGIPGATGPSYTFTAGPSSVGEYIARISDSTGTIFSDFAKVTVTDAPLPITDPVLVSVSPSTLPPSFASQLINIYGSNFKPSGDPNASTLIFRDPANNRYVRTPVFVSSSQLQYNITVQSAVGTWSVTVTNTGQAASNPKNLIVEAPSPNTGSLTVNLSPAGAISAGAQWRVDGGSYRNSGDQAVGLSLGSHSVSFKGIPGFTKPAQKSVLVTSGASTITSGSYVIDAPNEYTLSVNYNSSKGYVTRAPNQSTYTEGTVVRLSVSENTGFDFAHWSGDASGNADPHYITMDGNKSITANFADDPTLATVRVNISPSEAISDGAAWNISGPVTPINWQPSGDTFYAYRFDDYTVFFKDIAGWHTPTNIVLPITGSSAFVIDRAYQPIPGQVQVTIEPAAAVAAGAQWRLDGSQWMASGTAMEGVAPEVHTIEFLSVSGWTVPEAQSINVERADAVIAYGRYAPPPGFPLVNAVSPKSGPIEGGTLLTLDGANFTSNAMVYVRGQAASNVTFSSASQLTAITPAGTVFGSAEIVVAIGSAKATNSNSFAYGIARGTNMTLLASSGGMFQAVACDDDHLFIGQGTTLMVFSISDPSNPVPVSSVTVPGLIQDIAVNGNYAVVAANDAGVHIVDVSNASSPQLRGFYDTPGHAYGLEIVGNRAYVADRISNLLLILDIANPDAPTAISSLALSTFTFDVAVMSTSFNSYAYVAGQNKLFVVDVSNPTAPFRLSEVATSPRDNWSVAIAGNLAFLGRLANGVDAVDISRPANPVSLGALLSDVYVTVAALENTVVLAGQGSIPFQIGQISGTSTTWKGWISYPELAVDYAAYRMTIRNGYVWIAGGSACYGVNIANQDAPQRVFLKDEAGGRFEKIASLATNIAVATMGKVLGYNASGTSPILASSFSDAGQSGGLFFHGDILFNVDRSGGRSFQRFQVEANGSLSPIASFSISNVSPADASLVGNVLLSASSTKLVHDAVITEHDPSGVNWIRRQKHLPFDTGSGAIKITGGQDFFILGYNDPVAGDWKLAKHNWTDAAPIWQLPGFGSIGSLTISDNNRYLHVGEDLAYKIFDLMDSMNPVCVSTSSTLSSIDEIIIDNGVAYLAGGSQGVLVFDVNDKGHPMMLRSYNTPGSARSIDKRFNRLFVADHSAGIQVLGLPDITDPQIQIVTPVTLPVVETTNSPVNLSGISSDDSGWITHVTWSNDRGGGGMAVGTNVWSVTNVILQPGTNVIAVTAFDPFANASSDTLQIIYHSPKQGQSIHFPVVAEKSFGDLPFKLLAASSSGLPVSFTHVSGPAVLSNEWVTVTGAGIVTVQADASGDASFNPAIPIQRSFTVSKAEQFLNFPTPEKLTTADSPLLLEATSSSGLSPVFAIVSGPAIVNSNTLAFTNGGTVVVQASQPGNSNFNAASSIERSFVVTKQPQFIYFGMLTGQVVGDAPFGLSATTSSGLPVSYSVLSGPAVVSGNILTITGAGLVVLRAGQAGDNVYSPAANVDQVLIVTPGNNVITDLQRFGNGMFAFRFYGEEGIDYRVEGSTNLTSWEALSTNRISGLANFEFVDIATTNFNQRFYRVVPLSNLAPANPGLVMLRIGNEIAIKWPTNAAGYVLEAAADAQSSAWTNVGIVPTAVGAEFFVTNTISGEKRYYRLKK